MGFKAYVCFCISLVLRVGEGAGTGFAVVMTTTDDAIVTSRAAFTSVPLSVVLAVLIGQCTHQSQPGYSLSVYTVRTHHYGGIHNSHTQKYAITLIHIYPHTYSIHTDMHTQAHMLFEQSRVTVGGRNFNQRDVFNQ